MNKPYDKQIKEDIVEGYKGIMDLDLTYVEEKLKKQLTEQHMKDIANYKEEQYNLEPRLRYENTIERVRKIHLFDIEERRKRNEIQIEERRKYNEIYNSRLKTK